MTDKELEILISCKKMSADDLFDKVNLFTAGYSKELNNAICNVIRERLDEEQRNSVTGMLLSLAMKNSLQVYS